MFCIIIPAYRAGALIGHCVESLKQQYTRDFRAVIIDDASDDDTLHQARNAIQDDNRFALFQASENSGPLASRVAGIKQISPRPTDIIALVDGDDYLLRKDSLSIVQETYRRTGCWITYGSFLASSRREIMPHVGKRYPSSVIANSAYRQHGWLASHLKTFYYGLWSKVSEQHLRQADGRYWKFATDLAIMFPMLEMAGPKQEAISDLIYGYRDNLNTNEHVLYPEEQKRDDALIRQLPKYSLIESLL
ncbi:MAG: glycosyltransferase family 2 protein [Vulcanococcus sp.]